jgi:hypothetical protein
MTQKSIHRRALSFITGFAIACALVLGGSAFQQAHAQGVTVSPTRVVFEGRDRSAEIVLRNQGTERVTYRLGLQRMRMDEEGMTTVVVDEHDDERFADEYIRFSPRQVTLGPGEVQRVRLMARKPVDMEEGEYRAHLRFEALPMVAAPAPGASGDTEEFTIALRMLASITIPVIIRHGDLISTLDITNLEVHDGATHTVALTMARTGTRSVYGDIEIRYQPEDGEETVALRKGVAVYTPNDVRRMYIPLNLPEGTHLDGGRVTVSFKEDTSHTNRKGRAGETVGKVFAIPAASP